MDHTAGRKQRKGAWRWKEGGGAKARKACKRKGGKEVRRITSQRGSGTGEWSLCE